VTTGPGSAPLATTLPADPFTNLAVQFGMLLGVADFDALAANPRGKMRLHNAWLHGEGVVWGYPVTVDEASRELRVGPGLALDAVGHELYLSFLSCLDLGAWFDATSADKTAGLKVHDDGSFDAYVVVRYAACLAQPVPAMSSPCDGSANDIAYSRINETVELLLKPNSAPERRVTFPRLRGLFGVPATNQPDEAVRGALSRIADMPEGDRAQGWLDELRRILALETEGLAPIGLETGDADSSRLFPVDEPVDVVLAQLFGITLTEGADGTRSASVGSIDPSVRWSHVPTATIVELLSALGNTGRAGGTVVDAGGPRIDPSTAEWDEDEDSIVVTTSGTFIEGTIESGTTIASIHPTQRDAGWTEVPFTAEFDQRNDTLRFRLTPPPRRPRLVRVLMRGTGPVPVMGRSRSPDGPPVAFAGPVGGPPSDGASGADVAFMIERSRR
jgi:hypothetical protein